MPIVKGSTYKAAWIFQNSHISTIYPSLFRKPAAVDYQRERIETPDKDFLDLDWSKVGSDKLVILAHGLEGSAQNHYMTHAAASFNSAGVDALAMNYRGCSGEMNRLVKFYHSGKTEDLATIVDHVRGQYDAIYLVGFSIGGNIVLKYLGERADSYIKAAVTFAVPCCLEACAAELAKPSGAIYMKYFLKNLHAKIKEKQKLVPGLVSDKDFYKLKSFYDYDRAYTAPLNGFKDEYDYWDKASCKKHLVNIKTPSLIISAADDPFLAGDCYPVEAAEVNANLFLEMPEYGGHLGFANFAKAYWWQERMMEFIQDFSFAQTSALV